VYVYVRHYLLQFRNRYINSTSPAMRCFLTAEYRIRNIFPSSNVISSPLQLDHLFQMWEKVGEGILWKRDVTVNRRSDYSTENSLIHVWFLNHLLIPRIIKILKVCGKRVGKRMCIQRREQRIMPCHQHLPFRRGQCFCRYCCSSVDSRLRT
jgi:hypothetical protein